MTNKSQFSPDGSMNYENDCEAQFEANVTTDNVETSYCPYENTEVQSEPVAVMAAAAPVIDTKGLYSDYMEVNLDPENPVFTLKLLTESSSLGTWRAINTLSCAYCSPNQDTSVATIDGNKSVPGTGIFTLRNYIAEKELKVKVNNTIYEYDTPVYGTWTYTITATTGTRTCEATEKRRRRSGTGTGEWEKIMTTKTQTATRTQSPWLYTWTTTGNSTRKATITYTFTDAVKTFELSETGGKRQIKLEPRGSGIIPGNGGSVTLDIVSEDSWGGTVIQKTELLSGATITSVTSGFTASVSGSTLTVSKSTPNNTSSTISGTVIMSKAGFDPNTFGGATQESRVKNFDLVMNSFPPGKSVTLAQEGSTIYSGTLYSNVTAVINAYLPFTLSVGSTSGFQQWGLSAEISLISGSMNSSSITCMIPSDVYESSSSVTLVYSN